MSRQKSFLGFALTLILTILIITAIICVLSLFSKNSKNDNDIEHSTVSDHQVKENDNHAYESIQERKEAEDSLSDLSQFLGMNRTDNEQILGEPETVSYDNMVTDEIIVTYNTDKFYGAVGTLVIRYYNDNEDNHDDQYAFCINWRFDGHEASFEKYQETLNDMKSLIDEPNETYGDDAASEYKYQNNIWRSDEDYGGLNNNLEERNLKIVAVQ